MTIFNLSQIKPIPGFDSLKWKREIQAEILRETEGMTNEEVCEFYRQASERADQRCQALARRMAAENQQ